MKRFVLLLCLIAVFLSAGVCFAEEIQTGDLILLGRYEQDNDPENGPEPIEWQVLAAEDGSAVLISKYILDTRAFNDTRENVNWETCSLRRWLNEDFFDTAFTEDEKARILESELQNPDTSQYSMLTDQTREENDTTDRIFLLSIDELTAYFGEEASLICDITPYAKENCTLDRKGDWWLRSRGAPTSGYFSFVGNDGTLYMMSGKAIYPFGVRPAFRLDTGKQ